MAGFNGAGPNNMGPITGKGWGYCAMPAGNLPAGPYGRGFGGRGGGRRIRNRCFSSGPSGWRRGAGAVLNQEDNLRWLKEEAALLKQQMEDVENRINDIKKTD